MTKGEEGEVERVQRKVTPIREIPPEVQERIKELETRIEGLEEEVVELKRVMSSEGELERWRMKQQRHREE
jgi:peptidoglycan hydrolase CwlO-like protein